MNLKTLANHIKNMSSFIGHDTVIHFCETQHMKMFEMQL